MRKRLLVTIPRMPFPLNSGGRIAIYDALGMLSRSYTLCLVIIDDDKTNDRYISELKKFSNEIHFFAYPRYKCYINALMGLIRGNPLQMGYFYFKEVKKKIDELSLSCDSFYAFMIRTTSYGVNLPIKKGNYAIDSMYLNYKNSKDNATSLFWKLIYWIELPLLFKMEMFQVSHFDITTFVNKEEAAFWSSFGNVATIPHGVDDYVLNYSLTSEDCNNVVAFIGRMDYQPNIDAVMWFCKNVLEQLNEQVEFWVIGGYPTELIKNLETQYLNVRIKGFIDDPYKILRSCICTVAPMQTGGGLQTKILTAMALESIVVSTSLPITAIDDAANNVNLIVEDNPLQMAEKINDIYLNRAHYQYIKENAKKLINDKYSLRVIERNFLKLIENYL